MLEFGRVTTDESEAVVEALSLFVTELRAVFVAWPALKPN